MKRKIMTKKMGYLPRSWSSPWKTPPVCTLFQLLEKDSMMAHKRCSSDLVVAHLSLWYQQPRSCPGLAAQLSQVYTLSLFVHHAQYHSWLPVSAFFPLLSSGWTLQHSLLMFLASLLMFLAVLLFQNRQLVLWNNKDVSKWGHRRYEW